VILASAAILALLAIDKPASGWTFRNHVLPVLTKMGCNQGACHGALAGKGGFKLTLRGYDPELDYDTITRQSLGRRVSLAEPAESLLLRKATFATPHGGGKRFAKDSLEYQVIHDWVAAGAPGPQPNDKEVKSLRVEPSSATAAIGEERSLQVTAQYSDGSTADITRWAKFSSTDEGVATVDDNSGKVKVNGSGEAAITVWYSSKVLYARVSSPYPNQVDPKAYEGFPVRNFIDELALKKWRQLNLAPSPLATDSAFIRRAYLDAAGILPTAEEVEQFLADTDPNKRAKLVDRLLEREEFTDYWAYKLSDLLLVSSRKLNPTAMWDLYYWIRESVRTNKPWDQFAKEIFTSAGSTRDNGALNYFVLHKDPIDLTENVTQAFLGQRLTCARCHNHPLEKWTQKQYYQMANLFSRVGIKNGGEPGDNVVFAKVSGDINHPRLLKPMRPAPLDGTELNLDDARDRRAHFAEWLTSPQNPYFARNIVNRVWGNYFGRGLVDPIDDVRATNPASNEELFAATVKDFIANGHDLRRLMRAILNSSTYQLSSEANATNGADNKYYSKYVVRRLPAEVLSDAMSQVTGVPTAFPGMPPGTRALQLPDVRVQSQFLDVFGRPARIICDAGERSSDPSIAQALHVINGETLNRKLMAADGAVHLFIKLGLSDNRMIDQLYLSAFSRLPSNDERRAMIEQLSKAKMASGPPDAQRESRKQAVEDMAWAILTSKEFLFNH
jgi:hypothetical protein